MEVFAGTCTCSLVIIDYLIVLSLTTFYIEAYVICTMLIISSSPCTVHRH